MRASSGHRGGGVRGSALIVVLVIATAALIATYGILESSLNARVSVLRTVDGDLSDGIARAGMERAVAYLQAFGAGDYDEVLDPNWNANCNPPTFLPGAGGNQPRFTETGVVQDVRYPNDGTNERKYTLVPYNGGAYLVRFDDDADDMVRAAEWSSFTNNNLGNGDPDCIEGIESSSPSLLSFAAGGMENPVRDRNRALWIEVIGIYPGSDVDNVKYKTVYRKRHSYVPPGTVAGIQVSGDIQVTGAGNLNACSPVGSLQAASNVQATGAGDFCACGESTAVSFSPSPPDPSLDHCTAASMAGRCRVPCADGELSTASISVFNPEVIGSSSGEGPDYYFDWSRPCLFYSGHASASLSHNRNSLWFWEATAARGPNNVLCSTFEGSGHKGDLPWPPDPTKSGVAADPTDPENWRGCWTPLIVGANSILCQSPFAEAGVAGTQCAWRPNNVALPGVALVAPFNTLGFPVGTLLSKPAWGDACFVDYPPFDPSPVRYSCSAECDPTTPGIPCCNGVRTALVFNNNSNYHGDGMWWPYNSGTTADQAKRLAAIPAGVYIYDTSSDWAPSGLGGGPFDSNNYPVPASPTALAYPDDFPLSGRLQAPPIAGYPLMTMVYPRSLNPQIGFWLGIGQGFANPVSGCPPACPAGVHYPSLIVDNGNVSLRGNASLSFAGSIVVTNGNMDWNGGGNINLFGEIQMPNGNWTISGNGKYDWFYSDMLQRPPAAAGGAPLIHRARQ